MSAPTTQVIGKLCTMISEENVGFWPGTDQSRCRCTEILLGWPNWFMCHTVRAPRRGRSISYGVFGPVSRIQRLSRDRAGLAGYYCKTWRISVRNVWSADMKKRLHAVCDQTSMSQKNAALLPYIIPACVQCKCMGLTDVGGKAYGPDPVERINGRSWSGSGNTEASAPPYALRPRADRPSRRSR